MPDKLRPVRTAIVRALAFAGFLLLLITFTPVVEWWAMALAGPWNDAKGDTLILLAGDSIDGDIIGIVSYWRTVYAVWVMRDGGFKEVIVSGALPVTAPMRNFLIANGVPAASIIVEDRSRNTRENALFTCALLRSRAGRKVLLTSDAHMYRAWRAFRKAGCEVTPVPIPDVLKRQNTWVNRWPLFAELARETLKIAYYRARSWI